MNVLGQRVALSCWINGVYVLDLTNREKPNVVLHYDTGKFDWAMSSDFLYGNPAEDPERKTKEQEIQELIDNITDFVESEQWKVHGGNCTIRYYKGSLLVKAPDFVHRQLGGYGFTPIRPSTAKTRTMNFSGGSTTVRMPRVPNI